MKAPAWQWYPKDCDTDENVRGMDDREFGFYVRCLNHSWLNNGLPSDLSELARVMGRTRKYVDSVWKRVGRCFEPDDDGRLRNRKQESLRRRLQEYGETRKRGANARWGKHEQCTPDAHASEMQCSPISILHSASAENTSPPPPDAGDTKPRPPVSAQTVTFDYELGFSQLWESYPRKGRTKIEDSKRMYVQAVSPDPARIHAQLLAPLLEGGKWANSDLWAKGFVCAIFEYIRNRRDLEDPEPFGAPGAERGHGRRNAPPWLEEAKRKAAGGAA